MIGQVVRETRNNRGMTLTAAAEAAKVRAEHLSRFERGQREMSTATLRRVMEVLGLVVVPREHVVSPSEEGDSSPGASAA